MPTSQGGEACQCARLFDGAHCEVSDWSDREKLKFWNNFRSRNATTVLLAINSLWMESRFAGVRTGGLESTARHVRKHNTALA